MQTVKSFEFNFFLLHLLNDSISPRCLKGIEGPELRVQRGKGHRSRTRANLFVTRNTSARLRDVHLDLQTIGRSTQPRIAREDSRDHRPKVGEIFSLFLEAAENYYSSVSRIENLHGSCFEIPFHRVL